MQNTSRSLSLLAAVFLLAVFPLFGHTAAPGPVVRGVGGPQATQRLSFFQKIAFKTAERKLHRALKKQASALMRGDSTRPCGYVVLSPGERVEAELLEISAAQVTYRPCGQPSAAPVTRHKREVLAVVASNGDELFSGIYRMGPDTNGEDLDSPKLDGLAMLSLVFSLAPFTLAGPLLAILLGGISLDRIKKHPDRYKGRGLAMVGLILGLLGLVIVIAALGAL